jgi:hypothetical protein
VMRTRPPPCAPATSLIEEAIRSRLSLSSRPISINRSPSSVSAIECVVRCSRRTPCRRSNRAIDLERPEAVVPAPGGLGERAGFDHADEGEQSGEIKRQ